MIENKSDIREGCTQIQTKSLEHRWSGLKSLIHICKCILQTGFASSVVYVMASYEIQIFFWQILLVLLCVRKFCSAESTRASALAVCRLRRLSTQPPQLVGVSIPNQIQEEVETQTLLAQIAYTACLGKKYKLNK